MKLTTAANSPVPAYETEITALCLFNQYRIKNDNVAVVLEKTMPDVFKKIEAMGGIEQDSSTVLDFAGIDYLLEYKGRRYAIDLTVAKKNGVISKARKMAKRLSFYEELDALPVVLSVDNSSSLVDALEEIHDNYNIDKFPVYIHVGKNNGLQ